MKKLVVISFLVLSPMLSKAQYFFDYGFKLGAANYLGEMGGEEDTRKDFLWDMKLAKTRPTVGAFARYRLHRYLSIKTEFNYLRITGDDKLSTNRGRTTRNLSFFNNIFELGFEGQFFFYELNNIGRKYRYKNNFRMYAGSGIDIYFHNPKAKIDGSTIALRPLKTEGQAKAYSRVGFAVPVTAGFYYTIKKKDRIGFEISWRTTFSDYLDDVSTVYAADSLLSPEAAAVANRTDELDIDPEVYANPNNYRAGEKRGDPTHNDSYFTTTIYYSKVLRGKSKFYKARYHDVIFGRKKYKKRRQRAKF